MVFISAIRRAAADILRNFKPTFDRVLVERMAAEKTTKGGIMIPEKSQGKVLEATVVACGPGARDSNGKTIPMTIKVSPWIIFICIGFALVQYAKVRFIFDTCFVFICPCFLTAIHPVFI
ncbi:hypothetical protein AB6A40_007690 [Gnathostoma spinigerum]|uniref:10 kDa heat shock protein, mitochondrial n=1 Tax=Gnathostoma spinigerum TaxID=75299 RepID=A0ABD6EU53_9BILA